MYFYRIKFYKNEQTQLLEMRSHAFCFDGIGRRYVNSINH